MMSRRGPGQGFSLARWSRRKLEAAQASPAAPAASAPAAAAGAPAPAELPPVES